MHSSRQLIWCGPVFEPTGYADEGREMLMAMERAGMPVALRPVQKGVAGFADALPAEMRDTFARQTARLPEAGFVLAQHYPADGFVTTQASGYNVGRTMFETDSLPPHWVTRCNAMDEIWVPSQFNVESFRRAGVTVPLHRVPGGIDSSAYRPDVAPLAIEGARGTVFLAVLDWRARKGWDLMLRAWAEAFSPADDVTLVLRASTTSTPSVDDRIATFLDTACAGRSRRDVARIVVLRDMIAPADMPSLYTAAHAYVAPTRGEGWGRPFMEAMASGLPVIATRWSAHLEYMHDANSLLLDVDGLVPSVDPDEAIYAGQRWADPSVSHLVALLRRVHGDRAEARAIGARAREDMVNEWPWAVASDAIAARMRDIVPAAPAPARRTASADPLLRALAALRTGTDGAAASMSEPTITLLGEESADSMVRPSDGRWIIATGNLVTDRVPGTFALTLRDHADDVWVPHEAARCALMKAGVSEERIWVAPFGNIANECTPHGARFARPFLPDGSEADPVFLLAVLHEHDLASAETVVRVWQRTVGDAQARLRVVLPATRRDATHAWCTEWPSALAMKLTAHDQRVSFAELPEDRSELGALVRSGDVVIDAGVGPSSMALWQAALAAGRPVIAMQSADASAWLDGAGGQLVRAGVTRAMNGTELAAAIRDLSGADSRIACSAAARARALALPSWRDCAHIAHARIAVVLERASRTDALQLQAANAEPFHIEGARKQVLLLHADWHGNSVDEQLREFVAAHDMDAPVTLALCLDPAQGIAPEAVQGRVHAALASVGKSPDTAPDIVLIPDVLTDAVLAALYRRAETPSHDTHRTAGRPVA